MTDDRPELGFSTDWFPSGWERFLPRQAMALCILVSSATINEMDGSLEELNDSLGEAWFDRHTGGGVDAQVFFSHPDEEPDAEQRELDENARATLEKALAESNRSMPTTVRQLAELMLNLGIFTMERVDGTERWRVTNPLPLPAEALPLPAEIVEEQDRIRWHAVHQESEQELIRYVKDVLDYPDEVPTTIAALAEVVNLDEHDCRGGLEVLLANGDFSLVNADSTPVDPQSLSADVPVKLVIDWELFGQSRIWISKG